MHIIHRHSQKCCHFDEIFIIGCTGGCQNDNFHCSQWRKILEKFSWNFHHRLHCKLSTWQLPVQSVMTISAKWHFSSISVLCSIVVCYQLSFRVTSLALGKSYDWHWGNVMIGTGAILLPQCQWSNPDAEMERSAVWLPCSSLEMLKASFNVSSDEQGSHPDNLSISLEEYGWTNHISPPGTYNLTTAVQCTKNHVYILWHVLYIPLEMTVLSATFCRITSVSWSRFCSLCFCVI